MLAKVKSCNLESSSVTLVGKTHPQVSDPNNFERHFDVMDMKRNYHLAVERKHLILTEVKVKYFAINKSNLLH